MEDQRFNEVIEEGLKTETGFWEYFEDAPVAGWLHFETWIPECELCGAKDHAGDPRDYPAGETIIRVCKDCQ